MFCKKSTLVTFLFSLALLFASASASFSQDAAEGESLFKNNCAACHNTSDETLVGPGLKGVSGRRPIEWIVSWVHNPQAMIASGDKYANDLYNKFNKAAMTRIPTSLRGRLRELLLISMRLMRLQQPLRQVQRLQRRVQPQHRPQVQVV